MRLESDKNTYQHFRLRVNNLFPAASRDWMRANCDWPLILIFAVSILLVYGIPPRVILDTSFFPAYSSWITEVIPGLKSYISTSNIRPEADVYFPVMMLGAPLAGLWILRMRFHAEHWLADFWGSPIKNCFRIIGLGLILYFGTKASLIKGAYGIASLSIQDSKLNLALYGPIHAGGGSFLALALITRAIQSIRETVADRRGEFPGQFG